MQYFLMKVLGDNIQRDGAKRNRAEGGHNRARHGRKMRGMTALRPDYICSYIKLKCLNLVWNILTWMI